MLTAAGRIQKSFRSDIHGRVLDAQNDVSDLLGNVNSTRFTGVDGIDAFFQKSVIYVLADGGLAASFAAFKSNE